MPTASPTFLPKIPNTLKTPKTPKKAALRIFWEDREESPPSGLPPVSSGLSPDTTLSELFDRYFLPVYLRSTMADPRSTTESRTPFSSGDRRIGVTVQLYVAIAADQVDACLTEATRRNGARRESLNIPSLADG